MDPGSTVFSVLSLVSDRLFSHDAFRHARITRVAQSRIRSKYGTIFWQLLRANRHSPKERPPSRGPAGGGAGVGAHSPSRRHAGVHVLHASRDGPPGGMARSVGSSTPGSPHPAHQAGSVLSPGTRTSFPRAMSTAPEPLPDIPRVLAPAPTGHPQGIHAYGSPAVQNPDTTPSD